MDINFERCRKDNARLLSDNLDLCRKIDTLSERHEIEVKLLRRQAENVGEELADLGFIHEQAAKKIKALEQEIIVRDTQILELSSQGAVLIKGN